MEKMIAHIKKLAEENEVLKEENRVRREGVRYVFSLDTEVIKKLKEENKKLKETIDDTKEFLKVCDRNKDGYYEHYETRQIATRFEGDYQKEETTDK